MVGVQAELADDSEEHFRKLKRFKGEALFAYSSRSRAGERELRSREIELPAKVRGWLALRRGGCSSDQKAAIMAMLGTCHSQCEIIEALEAAFGQESSMRELNHARRQC